MYFAAQEIADFWQALTPYWGRRPGLLTKPFTRPLVSEREFLAILGAWGDEARRGQRLVDVTMVDADALPQREDESFAAAEQRIGERWSRDWYLYIPDGVQQYNGDVWERAVELMVPAIRLQGGLPSGGMMLDLFYGKYRSTPTGIHLDSSDNLAFIARGPKRMLFWPPGRFTVKFSSPPGDPSHQRTLIGRYEEHLADAIVIDADEGDVIYWPKEYWHIGASQDGWSGMVSIPMWWTAKPSSLARAMLTRVLDLDSAPQLYGLDVGALTEAAQSVPPVLQEVVGRMKSQVSSRLEPTARVAWARFVTAYGFSTPPAPRARVEVTSRTRIRVVHPIVAVPLGRAHAVVACGQSMVTQVGALATVVGQLRTGTEHVVADLEQAVSAPDAALSEPLTRMVSDLVACRALAVC